MEVLKIATAGSVDDGKSTLIGRILYDTKSLTDDKLEAIEKSSKQKGFDYLDFSLATDGLVAEREQGITIDVAHIYFSTQKRSYIIADTPGHVEYTRNMVTGASTSQVSIILIDARKGVIEQTCRHFFINNLLKVKNVIVAVNKMDLVDYAQDVFDKIKADVIKLAEKSDYKNQTIEFIPVSALKGDNIVEPSENMTWYTGDSILDYLENIKISDVYEDTAVRFPVQAVVRPKSEKFHDYRGYAGKIYGGSLSVGDEITVMPSNTTSKIKTIEFFKDSFETVEKGSSVTITLNDDINVSRGDMIVKSNELPKVKKNVNATVCWMNATPLTGKAKYILKHGVNDVLAKVNDVSSVLEINQSNELVDSNELKMNDIGLVKLKLAKPIYFDTYAENKANGSFILIDSKTNNTVGVGFLN